MAKSKARRKPNAGAAKPAVAPELSSEENKQRESISLSLIQAYAAYDVYSELNKFIGDDVQSKIQDSQFVTDLTAKLDELKKRVEGWEQKEGARPYTTTHNFLRNVANAVESSKDNLPGALKSVLEAERYRTSMYCDYLLIAEMALTAPRKVKSDNEIRYEMPEGSEVSSGIVRHVFGKCNIQTMRITPDNSRRTAFNLDARNNELFLNVARAVGSLLQDASMDPLEILDGDFRSVVDGSDVNVRLSEKDETSLERIEYSLAHARNAMGVFKKLVFEYNKFADATPQSAPKAVQHLVGYIDGLREEVIGFQEENGSSPYTTTLDFLDYASEQLERRNPRIAFILNDEKDRLNKHYNHLMVAKIRMQFDVIESQAGTLIYVVDDPGIFSDHAITSSSSLVRMLDDCQITALDIQTYSQEEHRFTLSAESDDAFVRLAKRTTSCIVGQNDDPLRLLNVEFGIRALKVQRSDQRPEQSGEEGSKRSPEEKAAQKKAKRAQEKAAIQQRRQAREDRKRARQAELKPKVKLSGTDRLRLEAALKRAFTPGAFDEEAEEYRAALAQQIEDNAKENYAPRNDETEAERDRENFAWTKPDGSSKRTRALRKLTEDWRYAPWKLQSWAFTEADYDAEAHQGTADATDPYLRVVFKRGHARKGENVAYVYAFAKPTDLAIRSEVSVPQDLVTPE